MLFPYYSFDIICIFVDFLRILVLKGQNLGYLAVIIFFCSWGLRKKKAIALVCHTEEPGLTNDAKEQSILCLCILHLISVRMQSQVTFSNFTFSHQPDFDIVEHFTFLLFPLSSTYSVSMILLLGNSKILFIPCADSS